MLQKKVQEVKVVIYQTKAGYFVKAFYDPLGQCFKKLYFKKKDPATGRLLHFLFWRNM